MDVPAVGVPSDGIDQFSFQKSGLQYEASQCIM